MTPIGSLQSGQRFRLAALEKEGVLVRLGECSAAVRYGGTRHVALPNGREFDAKGGEVVTISLATDVIPLEVLS